jgi:EF-hand domain
LLHDRTAATRRTISPLQSEGQRMRTSAIALVIALALAPGVAFAQSGPPASGPPAGGPQASPPPPGAISREQYVERAARNAGRRFDKIDVNHTGYITREQLRAFMAERRRGGPPQPEESAPTQ